MVVQVHGFVWPEQVYLKSPCEPIKRSLTEVFFCIFPVLFVISIVSFVNMEVMVTSDSKMGGIVYSVLSQNYD